MNPSPEEGLFQLALAKPAEKRAAFLDAMCEGDAALRQRLEAPSASSILDPHSGFLPTGPQPTALNTIFHDTL